MGIFGTKKEADAATTKETAAVVTAAPKEGVRSASSIDRDLAGVLVKARVSEKAYYATEKGVYVFEVRMDATKHDVRDAIRAKYNVTPRKINITKQNPRSFFSRQRGRAMTKRGLKKAYVYLKAGDTIELV